MHIPQPIAPWSFVINGGPFDGLSGQMYVKSPPTSIHAFRCGGECPNFDCHGHVAVRLDDVPPRITPHFLTEYHRKALDARPRIVVYENFPPMPDLDSERERQLLEVTS